MLYLNEFKKEPSCLADLLPFAGLVDEKVMLLKDGAFLSTFRFRGRDLDSATEEELVSVSYQINNVLKRLGSGWAIYVDAVRKRAADYGESSYPEPVTFLIDQERKSLFEGATHFESSYYLSLIYLPPSDSEAKFVKTFFQKDDQSTEKKSYKKLLESFALEISRIENLFQTNLPEFLQLKGSEFLTYLHSLVSTKDHPVQVPEVPMYLDAILADTPLAAGLRPKLGDSHLRTISIKSFPVRTWPGVLERLNRLGMEYRWSTRFIALDRRDAEKELKTCRRKWFAKRKSLVGMLREMAFHEASVEDADALNKTSECDTALEELNAESVSYGYYTGVFVLRSEDEQELEQQTKEIERVINAQGFTCKVETANSVDAWLGTIPGNCRNNVRRPLIHTLNLSHLLPLQALWAGPERNEHLNGPPVFQALTSGATKFRFVNAVNSVQHMSVIGPTGAGKSVFLMFLAAQFLRYQGAQVYIFDKGGSARALTTGVGGDYFELGGRESKLNFQPLKDIDKPHERRWAHSYVLDLLEQENVELNPSIKETVWVALESLSSAPVHERHLFGLSVIIQDHTIRQALLPFTMSGPHGHLLDNKRENFSDGSFQTFEMEELMHTKQAVMPVLSYIFHRLEQRFTGAPTLLILDEAWTFLDHPAFATKLREWLKVLRKANVGVVFATQSLSDVDKSSISETVRESCLTNIFLPNASAMSDGISEFYERFGLNRRERQLLQQSTPKCHYYYKSPVGSRLFELSLGEIALAYCGATSKEEQSHVERLSKESESTIEFNIRFLMRHKIEWAEEALRELKEQKEAA